MASVTITRGTTLPNSSAKSDFHNLVDTATATVTNIVNADVDSAAAIASSKLDLSAITQALVMSNKIFKMVKGADVASTAGTITLGDDGNYFDITGTAAITSITAKTAGTFVILQFDSTASLVDGSNLKLQGNFSGVAEAQIALVSDGTNWFEVSRNLSFTPSASNALAGSVVQVVNTQSGTMATGTTTIPNDNTIPQNTEGTEFITRAITPTSATNKLKITVVAVLSSSINSASLIGALFQDTTANALASAVLGLGTGIADHAQTMTFVHYMTSGTTSSTTFKFRAGLSSAGTVTFNGEAGASLMGGVYASSITIEEIKV